MKSLLRIFLYAALAAALCAAFAGAEEVKAGDLVITQAWSRATPNGAKIAGGYLTIENKGSASDRLVGSSSDVAGKVAREGERMDGGPRAAGDRVVAQELLLGGERLELDVLDRAVGVGIELGHAPEVECRLRVTAHEQHDENLHQPESGTGHGSLLECDGTRAYALR